MATHHHELAKIIGKGIFLSSITSAIASVEMSSKFSVMNFSKDQLTLQRAADALRNYMIIGTIWTIGVVLYLYASYGARGGWIGLMTNAIMQGWIYFSYVYAFKQAAKEHGLQEPTVFSPTDIKLIVVGTVILCLGIAYLSGYNFKKLMNV